MILLLIIYLIGIPFGYLSYKRCITRDASLDWTKGDRVVGLVISLASWMNVVADFLFNLSENNKKASW